MFCQKCGQEMPDGAQFCMKCGAKVEKEQPKVMPRTVDRNQEIAELEKMIEYFSQKAPQYAEYDTVCLNVNHYAVGFTNVLRVIGILVVVFGSFLGVYMSEYTRTAQYGNLIVLVMLAIGVGMIVANQMMVKRFRHGAAETYQRYDLLTVELYENYMAYGECAIGCEYTNPNNLRAILEMIESGRADTAKDAINMLMALFGVKHAPLLTLQSKRRAASLARGATVDAVFYPATFFNN